MILVEPVTVVHIAYVLIGLLCLLFALSGLAVLIILNIIRVRPFDWWFIGPGFYFNGLGPFCMSILVILLLIGMIDLFLY